MSYNKEKMKESITLFLEAIGHPADDENIKETPERVADMYEVCLGGYDIDPKKYIKTFPSNSTTPVYETNVQFFSFCAHHLLPFEGKIHMGYKPNGKVLGLSKLVRMPRVFFKRLNLQEDLTQNIHNTFCDLLETKDVIVQIESSHSCMTHRGVRSPETITMTRIGTGIFENEKYINEFKDALNIKVVRSY